MNTVWVLIAIIGNGHLNNFVVPTLEFKTEAACKNAVIAFQQETSQKVGTSVMRCVKIEK